MRVPFKNLGQAELYLKTCASAFADHLRLTGDVRLPAQRVRNALCRGFGYSSYAELKRVLTGRDRDSKPLPSEVVLLDSFTKGFNLVFDLAAEYGRPPDQVDLAMVPVLAQGVLDELKREGSARDLFTQAPNDDAEELMDSGWEVLQYGDPREAVPEHLLARAEEMFSSAVSANPDLADAYNGLAFIAFSQGNYEVSRRLSETALEKAMSGLGTDTPEAYSWYLELHTRPYMRARYNLGLSLMRLGDLKGAVREFRELLKRNPNDNQGVRYFIGPLYHRSGDLRHAIPAYRRAAGTDEKSGDPHNEFNYGLALFENGKHEEAVLRFRYGTFRNLHIPQVLLGLPVERYDIWYGMDQAEPDYAFSYDEEYGSLWEGKTAALAFQKAVYYHPTVQHEVAEFLDLHRRLDAVSDVGRRMLIAQELSRLTAPSRLMSNIQAIAAAVR
jgi:tetratricopeptide (TPR) repeat protein